MQLVPSCILSVASFRSPAPTLPGLARLERKLLPSQTFLPHLCHCRVWTVVGNPGMTVHDGSGQGRVSPPSAVQADAAVLDMACSSRHGIYIV